MTIRYDFSGRTALVIGGTSGIGRAAALAFGRAGANVAVVARGEDAGKRTCTALAKGGTEALFVRADVRDAASIDEAVARTLSRFGRLDFAANCAGSGGDMAPLETASQAVWDDVMAVNARGVWLAMRSEIPAMLKTGGGAIVNMSSIYGAAGKAAHHAYVASKHAVLGMTRSVALEYATRGVRINAICAGITRTAGMHQAEVALPALVHALVAEHPMKRMASEDEIAAAILWLCSPDSGFVTGAPLLVDGGFLAA
jgi:NAD(P)-dependent dehydrogenase (short-subunit alcohol dehydrogenase family)